MRIFGRAALVCAMAGWVALAAGPAHASEYGRCVKVRESAGAYRGAYEDSACTHVSEGATGRYEWYPWGSPKQPRKDHYRAYSDDVELKLLGGTITCRTEAPHPDSFDGQITSTTGGPAVVYLTGCAGQGSEAQSGVFAHRNCSTAESRGEDPVEEIEFAATTRLGPGPEAQSEYVLGEPVTIACYEIAKKGPAKLEIRFSGSFGGPITSLVGEMARVSEVAITEQGLEAQSRDRKSEPWGAPGAMEFVDPSGVLAHYGQAIEIRAG